MDLDHLICNRIVPALITILSMSLQTQGVRAIGRYDLTEDRSLPGSIIEIIPERFKLEGSICCRQTELYNARSSIIDESERCSLSTPGLLSEKHLRAEMNSSKVEGSL